MSESRAQRFRYRSGAHWTSGALQAPPPRPSLRATALPRGETGGVGELAEHFYLESGLSHCVGLLGIMRENTEAMVG